MIDRRTLLEQQLLSVPLLARCSDRSLPQHLLPQWRCLKATLSLGARTKG